MKRMYAVEANRVFLASVAVSQIMIYFVVGMGVRDSMMLQFLIEAFLMLPGILYLTMKKTSVKEGLGIRSVGWTDWLLLVPFALCLDKIAEFLNVVSQLFVTNNIGNHVADLVINYPFPVVFFVVAVMTPACEELIYRGVLFQNYRKSGKWVAIFLTAFLFGMMHMDLNQFSYAFVLGFLFAVLNEITGSVLPAYFMHMYINGRSVVILYASVHYLTGLRAQYTEAEQAGDTGLMEQLRELAGDVPVDSENWLQEYMNMGDSSVTDMIPALLPGFLLALAAAAVILFLMIQNHGGKEKLRDLFSKEEKTGEYEGGKVKRGICSPELVVGILFCAAYMLLTL